MVWASKFFYFKGIAILAGEKDRFISCVTSEDIKETIITELGKKPTKHGKCFVENKNVDELFNRRRTRNRIIFTTIN